MLSKNGLIIVVSGPSGVGKGTICKKILAHDPNIVPSISATTRNKRENDIENVTYYFKSVEEFKKMIESGSFVEWAIYNDNYYGTPIDAVNELVKNGKDVLLEIDVQGALNLMKILPDAVYIFIAPENKQVLRDRLIGRGTESDDQIEKRINAADFELSKKDRYDYVVINKVLEDAVDETVNIINKRRNLL